MTNPNGNHSNSARSKRKGQLFLPLGRKGGKVFDTKTIINRAINIDRIRKTQLAIEAAEANAKLQATITAGNHLTNGEKKEVRAIISELGIHPHPSIDDLVKILERMQINANNLYRRSVIIRSSGDRDSSKDLEETARDIEKTISKLKRLNDLK